MEEPARDGGQRSHGAPQSPRPHLPTAPPPSLRIGGVAVTRRPARESLGALDESDDRLPSAVLDDYWVRAYPPFGSPALRTPTAASGKWLLFVQPHQLDEWWKKVRDATRCGELGIAAKAATAKPNPHAAGSNKVICVYTYDSQDRGDVMRVREALRGMGATWRCPYKEDRRTLAGEYAVNTRGRVSTYYE